MKFVCAHNVPTSSRPIAHNLSAHATIHLPMSHKQEPQL